MTLWDWLQLLIIPLVLAVAALLFNLVTTRTEQKIALDKQREDLLQKYLDCMSDLLLKEKFRSSAVVAEVRNSARVRTITILLQLDVRRIGLVFAFVREAGLTSKVPEISSINLINADLKKINLAELNSAISNSTVPNSSVTASALPTSALPTSPKPTSGKLTSGMHYSCTYDPINERPQKTEKNFMNTLLFM